MRTVLGRALVSAIVATVVVAGCARQPEAFSAKTPEELQQLSDVTEGVISLARSFEEGADPSVRRDSIRRTIAAVAAAGPQYEWHSDRILTRTNAETLGCIHGHAANVQDLEVLLARHDEAVRRQDEAKATKRKAMLQKMAMDVTGCAIQSSQFLINLEKRRQPLEHGAVLISEIYAVAATARAASGLSIGPLLEDQIRTYETILSRVGPNHEVPIVADALPKLREAAAMLEQNRSANVEPEPTTASHDR